MSFRRTFFLSLCLVLFIFSVAVQSAHSRLHTAQSAATWRYSSLEVGDHPVEIGLGSKLYLQEERSLDIETTHADEIVNLLMIDNIIFGQAVTDNELDTISLRLTSQPQSEVSTAYLVLLF